MNRQQQNDDCCDCNCCDDCDCNECGCDCFSAIETNCFQDCECCACCACFTAGDILTELNFHRHIDEEEQNQTLSEQFKIIIKGYKFVKTQNHPIFGETYMLQKGNSKLLLKSIWFVKKAAYQTELKQYLQNMIRSNIIQGLYSNRIQDICIDRWRICILYPRMHNYKSLNILSFIQQCSQQLLQYHLVDGTYFDSSLIFQDQDTYYVIPYYLQTDQNDIYQRYKQDQKLRHPPEWEKEDQFDKQQSDVFMMGLFILENALKSLDIYDDNILNAQKLSAHLQRVKGLLPSEIFIILSKMLNIQPNLRITLSAILNQTNGTQTQIVNDSHSHSQIPQATSILKENGPGQIYYPDGTLKYKGPLVDNLYHGNGHLYNQSAIVLVGQFNYKDLRDFSQYWTKYEGDFQRGKKYGYGIIYLSNNEKWAGEFVDDVPSGYGTWYSGTNQIHAKWIKGMLIA